MHATGQSTPSRDSSTWLINIPMPIQKNPQKLLEILHHLPLAIAIYDSADLRIAFANQTMLNIWLRDDSIIGRYFSDVFPAFKEGEIGRAHV